MCVKSFFRKEQDFSKSWYILYTDKKADKEELENIQEL